MVLGRRESFFKLNLPQHLVNLPIISLNQLFFFLCFQLILSGQFFLCSLRSLLLCSSLFLFMDPYLSKIWVYFIILVEFLTIWVLKVRRMQLIQSLTILTEICSHFLVIITLVIRRNSISTLCLFILVWLSVTLTCWKWMWIRIVMFLSHFWLRVLNFVQFESLNLN